jgi:hypothetical protein
MSRHERMAKYLEELQKYRQNNGKRHGHLILRDLDMEILRVQHWLLNPKEVPPHTYLGFHICPHRDRNAKRGYNKIITNRHINN